MPPDLPDLGAALAAHGVLTGQGPGGEVAPWIEQEALALWQAERAAVPVTSLTARRPDVDLVDAYRIQRAGAALRIVTGPAVPFRPGLHLPERLLTLRIGGAPAASGTGREVLGDPLAAVAWLARRLAAFGTGLKAGDIVRSGSVHQAVPLRPGMLVEAGCAVLPPVSARAL
ncbi:hypothetical protein ACFWXO_21990 [Kitasatospora sp. NPDC059088]|uniref:hypothetical protein n=1 Tax=Kitasatospora sp. NPDC059088 TaxID=3346722 RepID=UPI0036B81B50